MEKNIWAWIVGALVIGAVVGYMIRGGAAPAQPITPSPTPEAVSKPHEGFTLHIDAEKHFPGDEKKIAHHYCKDLGGMFECQLYDSDSKDARLVGVEVVVQTETWKGFSTTEQAMWHYHKEEIPKVNAKLPDLSEEEAAEVVKTLEETYGKIYLIWDPTTGDLPVGQPSVTILH